MSRVEGPLCLLAGALLLGPAACAGRGRSPEEAVRQYLAAVEQEDPAAAYALLSSEARRELPRDRFIQRFHEDREALRSEAAAVREGLSRGAAEEARVGYGSGLVAEVVLDRAPAPPGWHLAEVPTPRAAHAGTPEQAVQAFLHALEAQSWDALEKLLSPSVREAVQRELRERQAALREPARVEVSGDHGRVRFGRFELSLERAPSGEWRVVGVR